LQLSYVLDKHKNYLSITLFNQIFIHLNQKVNINTNETKTLSYLKGIAIKLKGHDCEKMVEERERNIITLPTVESNSTKINMGLFSNKIVELV
jgi:hypothetical protein